MGWQMVPESIGLPVTQPCLPLVPCTLPERVAAALPHPGGSLSGQSIQLRGERSFPGSFLTRLCLALVNGTSQGSVKKPLPFQLVKRPRTPSPAAHWDKTPLKGARAGAWAGMGSAAFPGHRPRLPSGVGERPARGCVTPMPARGTSAAVFGSGAVQRDFPSLLPSSPLSSLSRDSAREATLEDMVGAVEVPRHLQGASQRPRPQPWP